MTSGYGKAFPEGVADEQGLYKYEFELPAEWNGKQIELVFEGSMTLHIQLDLPKKEEA